MKPRLIRQRYSGKVMEVVREDDHKIIYGKVGATEVDRFWMSRELFSMKWDYYDGPYPPEDTPPPMSLPSEIGPAGPRPEKRGRGRPKGSKNKPKTEAA